MPKADETPMTLEATTRAGNQIDIRTRSCPLTALHVRPILEHRRQSADIPSSTVETTGTLIYVEVALGMSMALAVPKLLAALP